MKKILFIALCLVAAVGCNANLGDVKGIKNTPGVDISKGDDGEYVTSYEGALIPDDDEWSDGRSEMIYIISLIGEQKGAINDELFYERLTTKILDVEERFMYLHDTRGEDPDYWSWAFGWVGGQMTYDMIFDAVGDAYIRHYLSCAYHEVDSYLHENGYEGYHDVSQWHYDFDTHTLYTKDASTYQAKVLYFDGDKAVLRGHLYPMWCYYDPTGHYGYRRECPMELYLVKFVDGRDEFLQGFDLTWEDIQKLIEELGME